MRTSEAVKHELLNPRKLVRMRRPAVISSRQHAVVKAFKAAARGVGSMALLDGWHLLHAAEAAGIAIETVAIADQPSTKCDLALITRLEHDAAVDLVSVSTAVMHALSPVRSPAGVAALVRRTPSELSRTLSPAPALVIVAVDMQDPGNVGAVLRSAEAGGATGMLIAGASADAWGWKALRAAMGSTFRLPVVQHADSEAACHALRAAGVSLVAAVPRDGVAMSHTDLTGPIALLLGGEGSGLDSAIVAGADARISIPMQAPVDSLNAAVAAAVLVYEARRQRR